MARHRITLAASRMGRMAKTKKADDLLWSIYNELRAISREEGLAPTLKGLAAQLNRRGLRTNRGNEFDFKKVGAALSKLGLDRVAVERWKQQARDRAVEWQIAPESLYRQLWFEWQRHVVLSAEPFQPRLLRPDHWIPPWERDNEPNPRVMHPPPQARVVHLFLGPFEDASDRVETPFE